MAYRYWRIKSLLNAGDGNYTQFAEIELRATSGGADETAPGGSVTISHALQAGSAAGTVANDGTTTFAQIQDITDVSWTYDFGAGNEKDIVEVAIWGATGAANRAPGHFDVQYSDDNATYTTLWSCTAGTYTTNVAQVFTMPTAASAYRYWRTRFETCLSNVFSIAEMTMAESFGGADECTGGTGLARTGTVANAFDNNTATFWNSSSLDPYEYLGYDFGSGVTKAIIEMSLLCRQDNTNFQQWPVTLYAQAGSDNKNWLPIWTVPKSLMTYSDGAYFFRDPAAVTPGSTHRWWGIKPTALQSGTAFGVREIELRASIGGGDLTTGGIGGSYRPFSQANRSSYGYDSTTNEYGSASGQGTSDVLLYDYGDGNEKAAPAQIAITARDTGGGNNYNQAPTSFDLVYSDDGHTLTVQESFTSPATWTSTEQRLFAVAGGRRRLIIN